MSIAELSKPHSLVYYYPVAGHQQIRLDTVISFGIGERLAELSFQFSASHYFSAAAS